eukprot:m51a1_g4145 hypothetical protein (1429) ;mRNA; r:226994-232362
MCLPESSWVEVPIDGPLLSGSVFSVRIRVPFEWLMKHTSDLSLAGSLALGGSARDSCLCGMRVLTVPSPCIKSCLVQNGGLIVSFEGLRLHYCSTPQREDALRLWVVSGGSTRVAMSDISLTLPSKTLLRDIDPVSTDTEPPSEEAQCRVSAETTPVTPMAAQVATASAVQRPPSRAPSLLQSDDEALVSVLVSHDHLDRILAKMSDVELLDAHTRQPIALSPGIKRRRGRPVGKMDEAAKRLKNERARATRRMKEESAHAAESAVAMALAGDADVTAPCSAEHWLSFTSEIGALLARARSLPGDFAALRDSASAADRDHRVITACAACGLRADALASAAASAERQARSLERAIDDAASAVSAARESRARASADVDDVASRMRAAESERASAEAEMVRAAAGVEGARRARDEAARALSEARGPSARLSAVTAASAELRARIAAETARCEERERAIAELSARLPAVREGIGQVARAEASVRALRPRQQVPALEYVAACGVHGADALWAHAPAAMALAQRTISAALRAKCAEHAGAEVRAPSDADDAHVLSFHTAEHCVAFCLGVAEYLRNCEWPEQVLRHPLAAEEVVCGATVARGPRLCFGASAGGSADRARWILRFAGAGQLLCSSQLASALPASSSCDYSAREFGVCKVRGDDAEEEVFEVVLKSALKREAAVRRPPPPQQQQQQKQGAQQVERRVVEIEDPAQVLARLKQLVAQREHALRVDEGTYEALQSESIIASSRLHPLKREAEALQRTLVSECGPDAQFRDIIALTMHDRTATSAALLQAQGNIEHFMTHQRRISKVVEAAASAARDSKNLLIRAEMDVARCPQVRSNAELARMQAVVSDLDCKLAAVRARCFQVLARLELEKQSIERAQMKALKKALASEQRQRAAIASNSVLKRQLEFYDDVVKSSIPSKYVEGPGTVEEITHVAQKRALRGDDGVTRAPSAVPTRPDTNPFVSRDDARPYVSRSDSPARFFDIDETLDDMDPDTARQLLGVVPKLGLERSAGSEAGSSSARSTVRKSASVPDELASMGGQQPQSQDSEQQASARAAKPSGADTKGSESRLALPTAAARARPANRGQRKAAPPVSQSKAPKKPSPLSVSAPAQSNDLAEEPSDAAASSATRAAARVEAEQERREAEETKPAVAALDKEAPAPAATRMPPLQPQQVGESPLPTERDDRKPMSLRKSKIREETEHLQKSCALIAVCPLKSSAPRPSAVNLSPAALAPAIRPPRPREALTLAKKLRMSSMDITQAQSNREKKPGAGLDRVLVVEAGIKMQSVLEEMWSGAFACKPAGPAEGSELSLPPLAPGAAPKPAGPDATAVRNERQERTVPLLGISAQQVELFGQLLLQGGPVANQDLISARVPAQAVLGSQYDASRKQQGGPAAGAGADGGGGTARKTESLVLPLLGMPVHPSNRF